MINTTKILTYMGAAPFFILSVFSYINPEAQQIFSFLSLIYGGFITSFLAGSHWKKAVGQNDVSMQYVCMMPTIISVLLVIGAMVFDPVWLLPMLMILFVWLYRMDTKLSLDVGRDYLILRRNITVLICTLITLTFAVSYGF